MDHLAYRKIIDNAFEEYGDSVFCRFCYNSGVVGTRTFAQIKRYADVAETFFKEHGIEPGDRAVVLCTDVLRSFITFLSLTRCGITAVMLDPYLPSTQLCELILFSDARVIFSEKAGLRAVSDDILEKYPVYSLLGEFGEVSFIGGASEFPAASTPKTPENAAVLFSSGTTASMKGIGIPYNSLVDFSAVAWDCFGLCDGASIFEALPVCHVGGLMPTFACLKSGLVLCTSETSEPSRLFSVLKRLDPDVFIMIPKFYELMLGKIEAELAESPLKRKLYAVSVKTSAFLRKRFHSFAFRRLLTRPFRNRLCGENLRVLCTGSASIPTETIEALADIGFKYCNLYGSTEMNIPVCATTVADSDNYGAVGLTSRFEKYGIYVRIGEPDDSGIGEILVKSALRMNGYFRNPELTASSFDGEWFHTGDSGFIKDGYLHITGRIKDSIQLETGKRVSPSDAERLFAHAFENGVKYAVAGISDPDTRTDAIHMFIERGDMADAECELMKSNLLAFQRKELPRFALRGIHFIDAIPYTTLGKVKRYELAETLCASASSDTAEETCEDNVLNRVRRIIVSAANLPDGCPPDADLKNDLGIDSLTMMKIYAEIDKTFRVSAEFDTARLTTASAIASFIENRGFENTAFKKADAEDKNYPRKRGIFSVLSFRLFSKLLAAVGKLEADGMENLPDGQMILCPNHQSHFDCIWTYEALGKHRMPIRKFACLAKKEHFSGGFSEKLVRLAGGIPVDREGNVVPAYQNCEEFLLAGGSLLIHPEGTRTRSGKLGDFHGGAAELSVRTGVPIIPVTVSGAYAMFPAGSKKLILRSHDGKRNKIHISFGKPIYPCDKTVSEITALCRADIEAKLKEETYAE